MITEDERFIEIQAILAFSNINIENCTKINELILELSKENQELKQKYLNAVAAYETTMAEKGQLKKQLEEYLIQNINLRADIMIQKMASPNELIKDKTFYNLYDMPTYEELLVQQKEFIKYLEEEIKRKRLNATCMFEYNDTVLPLKEILQKYKSIIGVSDENN